MNEATSLRELNDLKAEFDKYQMHLDIEIRGGEPIVVGTA